MFEGNCWRAAVVAATTLFVAPARAGDACALLTRDNLTTCASSRSLAVEVERAGQRAAEGRREAARTVLPSMPALSLSGAYRWEDGGSRTALNWYATLSQEIAIGGQRGARKDAADALVDAQAKRRSVAEREAVAHAWEHYFDALAAAEALGLSMLTERLAAEMDRTAFAMSQAGAVAGTDADIARAVAIEAARDRLHAEQAERVALLELATAVGESAPGFRVAGALEPVRGVDTIARTSSMAERPEVASLRSEGRARRAEAKILRRARIPNPTVSIFAQRDGFGEHVLGAGLAFPLYLPHPLGPTNSGQIAEAESLAHKADTEAERMMRESALALARAIQNYEAAKAEVALYDEGKLAQARRTLSDIAAEVQSGKMPVREAIVIRRPLVDLLRGALTARHHLCLASVELARTSGLPFEGASR